MSGPYITVEESADLDHFALQAMRKMRERLEHGARKFGPLSWRHGPYFDTDNFGRLLRAADHLRDAKQNGADDEELAKRAADVANQAFMFADPDRMTDVRRG